MILTQEEIDRYLVQEPYVLKGSAIDITYQKFGRLTAVKPVGKSKCKGNIIWLLRCECGNYTMVDTGHLKSGKTFSCGCYRKEMLIKRGIPKNGNSLAEKFPAIASEWHPTKNGEKIPLNINWSCKDKVWWLGNCGHEWQSFVYSRTGQNKACPICCGQQVLIGFNDLSTLESELSKEWDYDSEHNNKLKKGNGPQFYTKGASIKVDWKCIICGYKWTTKIGNRTSTGRTGCPRCNESKGEKEVAKILDKYNIKYEREKSYPDLYGNGNGLLRFDFYLPKHNILIEYQGQQHYNNSSWYNEESKMATQFHDKLKRKFCKKNKIRLVEIHHKDFDQIEKIISDSLLTLPIKAV